MFWMHDGGVGWGWMLFGGLWMLVFWGGLIGLIVWGISRLTSGGEHRGGSQTPLEILRARYARGEISREEFQQMRRDLS